LLSCGLFIICLLLLTGCRKQSVSTPTIDESNASPTEIDSNVATQSAQTEIYKTRISPILPDYIKVSPAQQTTVSLQEFNTGFYDGGLVRTKTQGVCVEVDTSCLIKIGDFLDCEEFVEERVKLVVDDKQVVDLTRVVLTEEQVRIVDAETDKTLAKMMCPCLACWSTNLGLGPHLAEVHVKTPSGDETYAWMFTLVE